MYEVLHGIRSQLHLSGHWMAWNLVLAVIPWFLAAVLFRPGRRVGVAWWLELAAFIALLPNAAYVLTDIIHLPGAVRGEPSNSVVFAAILPMYAALFIIGFTAYCDSLRRMTEWLH